MAARNFGLNQDHLHAGLIRLSEATGRAFSPLLRPVLSARDIHVGRVVDPVEHLRVHAGAGEVLHHEHAVLVHAPPRFSERPDGNGPHEHGRLLDEYVALFRDGMVVGSSNVITLRDGALVYDLARWDRERRFRYTDPAIMKHARDTMVVKGRKTASTLKRAVWMGGNFSWNYYHLMFEYLVKFQALERGQIPVEVPVLIDQVCLETPQFEELLRMVNSEKRDIIPVASGKPCSVESLYYVRTPAIIPPNFVDDSRIRSEDVLFDPRWLRVLRERFLPFGSGRRFPRRIFISRDGASARRKFNEDEVASALSGCGYERVQPERLTVADQISMFAGAEAIAGGSGAAFTNLLFCSPGCRAMIFAKNPVQFSGFSTIACLLGVDATYVCEEAGRKGPRGGFDIQASFHLDQGAVLHFEELANSPQA